MTHKGVTQKVKDKQIAELRAENKRLKKVAINVADDLRYLTQEGRSSIPNWIRNRVSYCVIAIDEALKGVTHDQNKAN
jgi:hypothetical protein